MKKVLLLVCVLYAISANAQKEFKPYGYIAPGVFVKSNTGRFYPTAGVGMMNSKSTVAFGICSYHLEGYGFTLMGDIWVGIPGKPGKGTSVYVFFQPGKSLYSKTIYSNYIEARGGFAFNTGIGFFGKKKIEGFAPHVKFGYTSTSINTHVSAQYGGTESSTSSSITGAFLSLGVKF